MLLDDGNERRQMIDEVLVNVLNILARKLTTFSSNFSV